MPAHNSRVWVIEGVAYQSADEAAEALGLHRTTIIRRCNGCVREGRVEPSWPNWFSYAAPVNLKRPILAEEARKLAGEGYSGPRAAERLGLNRNQLAGIARDFDIQFQRRNAVCAAS